MKFACDSLQPAKALIPRNSLPQSNCRTEQSRVPIASDTESAVVLQIWGKIFRFSSNEVNVDYLYYQINKPTCL
jgi:hypothetical protein